MISTVYVTYLVMTSASTKVGAGDDSRGVVTTSEIIGQIRLRKFEERFTLVGNFQGADCPSKRKEKMLRNH